jgi:MoaA/NifB/PqqE/SkfB family radical SAM enzyme
MRMLEARKRSELSTDEAKQVIDVTFKVAGIGLPAFHFSGGEPLARSDFFELQHTPKTCIGYVSIASNGTINHKGQREKELKMLE